MAGFFTLPGFEPGDDDVAREMFNEDLEVADDILVESNKIMNDLADMFDLSDDDY